MRKATREEVMLLRGTRDTTAYWTGEVVVRLTWRIRKTYKQEDQLKEDRLLRRLVGRTYVETYAPLGWRSVRLCVSGLKRYRALGVRFDKAWQKGELSLLSRLRVVATADVEVVLLDRTIPTKGLKT